MCQQMSSPLPEAVAPGPASAVRQIVVEPWGRRWEAGDGRNPERLEAAGTLRWACRWDLPKGAVAGASLGCCWCQQHAVLATVPSWEAPEGRAGVWKLGTGHSKSQQVGLLAKVTLHPCHLPMSPVAAGAGTAASGTDLRLCHICLAKAGWQCQHPTLWGCARTAPSLPPCPTHGSTEDPKQPRVLLPQCPPAPARHCCSASCTLRSSFNTLGNLKDGSALVYLYKLCSPFS